MRRLRRCGVWPKTKPKQSCSFLRSTTATRSSSGPQATRTAIAILAGLIQIQANRSRTYPGLLIVAFSLIQVEINPLRPSAATTEAQQEKTILAI